MLLAHAGPSLGTGRGQASDQKQQAGGEAGASAEATEQQQGGDEGVVATMRVHGSVLVQRSAYFRAILLGGGADMVEGRTRVVTVELENEQGGLSEH